MEMHSVNRKNANVSILQSYSLIFDGRVNELLIVFIHRKSKTLNIRRITLKLCAKISQSIGDGRRVYFYFETIRWQAQPSPSLVFLLVD